MIPSPSIRRWPGILEHKLSTLEGEHPVCAYEAVRMDLSDVAGRRELFGRVGAASQTTLVVTEGLLIYLGDTAVRGPFYESLRLDRTFRLARFWNFVSRFTGRKRREKMRRFSGIVLYQRQP